MSNNAYFMLIIICNSKIHILYELYLVIKTNEMTFYSYIFLLQLQIQELECEIHWLLLKYEELIKDLKCLY